MIDELWHESSAAQLLLEEGMKKDGCCDIGN
jgi:hypothetical protein